MKKDVFDIENLDFSDPEREFPFQGHIYQVKRFGQRHFMKRKSCRSEFIYILQGWSFAEPICSQIAKDRNKYTDEYIENYLNCCIANDHRFVLNRCLQYNQTIFAFGIGDSFYWCQDGQGGFFHWKIPKNFPVRYLLEEQDNSFVELIPLIWKYELPKNELDFIPQNSNLEFLCGSDQKLRKLATAAAWLIPELTELLAKHQEIIMIFQSDNDYFVGGCKGFKINSYPKVIQLNLSEQAWRLLDIIFEYNYFIGLHWQYNNGISNRIYGYDPYPLRIEIPVKTPSFHERMEACLELNEWLQGKLPDDEIRPYFEG